LVGFQVFITVSLKMPVFWDVAPCSLVNFNDVSEVLTVCMIKVIALKMEAVIISETPVSTRLQGAASQKTGTFI
jgi:hypothetical protein